MKLWMMVCLASLQFTGAPASTGPANAHSKFDAHHLKTETFTYRDREDKGDVGQSKITVEQIPGANTYSFSSVVSGKFSQRWRAVTTSGFDPISANLSFGEGSGTPAFDLNYAAGRVTGFVVDRKGPTAGTHGPHEAESVATAQHAIARVPLASENENE